MIFFATAIFAPAQEAATTSTVAIDHFEFSYGLAHPDLPPLTQLNALTIHLSRTNGVWSAPTATSSEVLTIGSIPADSQFDREALRVVAQELVRWYNSKGLFGVWVAYSDLENGTAGIVDNRAADFHGARIAVWASQVAEVRTLARGQRFKSAVSINNPRHRRIIKNSPLHAGATPDQPGSLFRQGLLNAYLRDLSLHPGRQVEASIASYGQPGKIVLDYLVNENKPWQIFAQISNYGTKQAGVWRGRLGYQDNQFTNHDDVLNVDLVSTPNFNTYGGFMSYRFPLIRPAKLMLRVYGSYGDYLADDPNPILSSLKYTGKNWVGGLELSNHLTLPHAWELTTAVGANYDHYSVKDLIVDSTTNSKQAYLTAFSNFLVPFVSSRLDRNAAGWSVGAGFRFESTVGKYANTSVTNGIPAFGRQNADSDWTSLRWNAGGSIFLESLFKGGADAAPYLANEVSLNVRGRFLLRGKRLIPHEQEPIGGALSVRGYDESVLYADDFTLASFEYAFHIPRLLKPGEPGKLFGRSFKWRPLQQRQRPDWDLIFRGFADYGYRGVGKNPTTTTTSTAATQSLNEKSVSLAGAGAGIEFVVKQNFSIRCDVGMALKELRDDSLTSNQVIEKSGSIHTYVISSFAW